MNTALMICPVCGAPLKWGGPITLPEEDERAGEMALFFSWLCGHQALLPYRKHKAAETPPGRPAHECGAGDHDVPYQYVMPTAENTAPFDERTYARLLRLRGRAQDGAFADDGYPGSNPSTRE